jgi:SAM-dependent methyltransferase
MPAATTASFFESRIRLRGLASGLRACTGKICSALVRPNWFVGLSTPDISWQRYWGDSYGTELKHWLLKPVFEELENTGRIGGLIVDVGSGAVPVTEFLKRKAGRKRILIDIAAADDSHSADELRIRLDAESIGRPAVWSMRKALLRLCKFLEIDPLAARNTARADTIVFSDILNYVDFREVLRGFATYLKPGGRIIVSNMPVRGNAALFSGKGLHDNRQLQRFLDEHHFEIEHKSFPCRPRGETDEAEELIVLVARKPISVP